MKQYYDLVNLIRETGDRLPNRTGIDAITIPGAMMTFRMKDGFPMLGGRFTPFKSMIGEMCGFYRATTSAAGFRGLGCKVWDKNANDPGKEGHRNAWLDNIFRQGEDDLGPVYGDMWRNWPGYKLLDQEQSSKVADQLLSSGWEYVGKLESLHMDGKELWYKKFDQLGDAIRTVIKNPESRRILFHGWNPAVNDQIALPACHLLYQLLPNPKTRVLNMCVYQRSCDAGLGLPYNQSQASAQLHVISRLTGYTPGTVTMFLADVHIYVNQLEWLDEQQMLQDAGLVHELPTLEISSRIPSYDPADNVNFTDESGNTQIDHLIEWLALITPEDFTLHNYKYHTMKTPTPEMAV